MKFQRNWNGRFATKYPRIGEKNCDTISKQLKEYIYLKS